MAVLGFEDHPEEGSAGANVEEGSGLAWWCELRYCSFGLFFYFIFFLLRFFFPLFLLVHLVVSGLLWNYWGVVPGTQKTGRLSSDGGAV
jgi:hypothetical protein